MSKKQQKLILKELCKEMKNQPTMLERCEAHYGKEEFNSLSEEEQMEKMDELVKTL